MTDRTDVRIAAVEAASRVYEGTAAPHQAVLALAVHLAEWILKKPTYKTDPPADAT